MENAHGSKLRMVKFYKQSFEFNNQDFYSSRWNFVSVYLEKYSSSTFETFDNSARILCEFHLVINVLLLIAPNSSA